MATQSILSLFLDHVSFCGLDAVKTHSDGDLLAAVWSDSNLLVDIEMGLWLINKTTPPLLVHPSCQSHQMCWELSAPGDCGNFCILLLLPVAKAARCGLHLLPFPQLAFPPHAAGISKESRTKFLQTWNYLFKGQVTSTSEKQSGSVFTRKTQAGVPEFLGCH